MAVRTTVDIPDRLHDRLRRRAQRSGTSIRALIIRAIEQGTAPFAAKPALIKANAPIGSSQG